MSDEPGLPFRVLRRGLRAASRAGATVVERVLRNESQVAPFLGRAPGLAPQRAPTGPVEVRFGATSVRVARGTTLLEAAEAGRLDLRHYCGGNSSCGTCRIVVVKGHRNLSKREGMEEMALGADHVSRGDRLACQAQVLGEVEIEIPEWF
ncbi:MAG: 2Fe-2S iron-sulfur cluster-binding protein [Pseudomonadota bacterium]|nr:2Fe-2S iron-sulfur cluster-binding protein [Pseudomonadota bacterium]